MTRDQAISLMDCLIKMGYTVQVTGSPSRGGYVHPVHGDAPLFSVDVSGFSVDKVDVKALTEVADKHNLDLGTRGNLTFAETDPRHEAVRTQRRHPRGA